jgi:hypothetical protein
MLPDTMKRAMAGQAETERERRAKIINAEGEFQAAEKLVQAAAMMSGQPIALQLRYLQTMKEISSEHNTTTFLPIPMDLFALLSKPTNPRSRQVLVDFCSLITFPLRADAVLKQGMWLCFRPREQIPSLLF